MAIASFQCLVWGVGIVFRPAASAHVYGMDRTPAELFLWQGIGLVLLLFALGYALAAWDPVQHWGLIAVGLTAKVLGPAGMLWAVWNNDVSSRVLMLLPVNDVIWWLPFAWIIRESRVRGRDPAASRDPGVPS
jgi:hypothetical protein